MASDDQSQDLKEGSSREESGPVNQHAESAAAAAADATASATTNPLAATLPPLIPPKRHDDPIPARSPLRPRNIVDTIPTPAVRAVSLTQQQIQQAEEERRHDGSSGNIGNTGNDGSGTNTNDDSNDNTGSSGSNSSPGDKGEKRPKQNYFRAVPHPKSQRKAPVSVSLSKANGKPLKSCLKQTIPPQTFASTFSTTLTTDLSQPPTSPQAKVATFSSAGGNANIHVPAPCKQPPVQHQLGRRHSQPHVSVSTPASASSAQFGSPPQPQRTPHNVAAPGGRAIISPLGRMGLSPRRRGKRSVRFAPKIYVRPTIHVADMPNALLDIVWYSSSEFRAMKNEVQRTAQAIMSGRDLYQEEQDFYRQKYQYQTQNQRKQQKKASRGNSKRRSSTASATSSSSSSASSTSSAGRSRMLEDDSDTDDDIAEDEKADQFDTMQLYDREMDLLCSRGCESKTKEGSRWRSQHKLAAWIAVLDEQDRQYDLGIYCDWHQLSYEYQMVTRPCTNRAWIQGMKDQQEIDEFLQDARDAWYGCGADDGRDDHDGNGAYANGAAHDDNHHASTSQNGDGTNHAGNGNNKWDNGSSQGQSHRAIHANLSSVDASQDDLNQSLRSISLGNEQQQHETPPEVDMTETSSTAPAVDVDVDMDDNAASEATEGAPIEPITRSPGTSATVTATAMQLGPMVVEGNTATPLMPLMMTPALKLATQNHGNPVMDADSLPLPLSSTGAEDAAAATVAQPRDSEDQSQMKARVA